MKKCFLIMLVIITMLTHIACSGTDNHEQKEQQVPTVTTEAQIAETHSEPEQQDPVEESFPEAQNTANPIEGLWVMERSVYNGDDMGMPDGYESFAEFGSDGKGQYISKRYGTIRLVEEFSYRIDGTQLVTEGNVINYWDWMIEDDRLTMSWKTEEAEGANVYRRTSADDPGFTIEGTELTIKGDLYRKWVTTEVVGDTDRIAGNSILLAMDQALQMGSPVEITFVDDHTYRVYCDMDGTIVDSEEYCEIDGNYIMFGHFTYDPIARFAFHDGKLFLYFDGDYAVLQGR